MAVPAKIRNAQAAHGASAAAVAYRGNAAAGKASEAGAEAEAEAAAESEAEAEVGEIFEAATIAAAAAVTIGATFARTKMDPTRPTKRAPILASQGTMRGVLGGAFRTCAAGVCIGVWMWVRESGEKRVDE